MARFWRLELMGIGALVLVAASSSMFSPRRRRQQLASAASEARDRSADVFVDLDRLQKFVAAQVVGYAEAATPSDSSIRSEHSGIDRAADTGVACYLAALDSLPDDASDAELARAASAFADAEAQMRGALGALSAFSESTRPEFARAARQREIRAARAAAAAELIERAVACTAAASADRVWSAELSGLLDQARALHGGIRATVATTAAAGMDAKFAELTIVVVETDEASARLRDDRVRYRRDTSSLRGLVQVVETHLSGVEPQLSILRRGYPLDCSSDLEDTAAVTRRLVATGLAQLAEADEAARTGDYTTAVAEHGRACAPPWKRPTGRVDGSSSYLRRPPILRPPQRARVSCSAAPIG